MSNWGGAPSVAALNYNEMEVLPRDYFVAFSFYATHHPLERASFPAINIPNSYVVPPSLSVGTRGHV